MARYAVNNGLAGSQQNLSTAYKSIVTITAATGATTLRRGWIDEIEVGADGTPNATDCQIVWDWSKQTAAGTITAATPVTTENSDAAALLVYSVNATIEGTVTAASSLLTFPANQRGSQRWNAKDQASALIVPATNVAGVAGRAKSTTYASTVLMHQFCIE